MTDDTTVEEKETNNSARVYFCWTYYGEDVEDNLPCIPDEDCVYRIQGKETCPETGRRHLQCFAHLRKRVRWQTLHNKYPTLRNLKICKGTPYQNFEYCSKDGDFKEFGVRPKGTKQSKDDEQQPFSQALNSDTIEEGIRVIKEKRPRDWCLHSANITWALQQNKKKKFSHKHTKFNLEKQVLNKATLFCGPSGIGKTAYALWHFENPLMITHMDKLRELTPDNDGLVFDDMSFKHYPPEAVIQILDMDYDRDIHARYRAAVIPAGLPRIFTHNTDNPFYDAEKIDEEQRVAIERRLDRIRIDGELF